MNIDIQISVAINSECWLKNMRLPFVPYAGTTLNVHPFVAKVNELIWMEDAEFQANCRCIEVICQGDPTKDGWVKAKF